MKNKQTFKIYLILTIIWMGVIFLFSSQNGETSGSLSFKVVEAIRSLLHYAAGIALADEAVPLLHHLVRKGAHFTVYAVLGILVNTTIISAHNIPFTLKQYIKLMLLSVVISFLYAGSDEIHQSFIAGRGPAFTDVLIDTSGSAVGTLLLWLRVRRSILANH